jgi:hypothetical protein
MQASIMEKVDEPRVKASHAGTNVSRVEPGSLDQNGSESSMAVVDGSAGQ